LDEATNSNWAAQLSTSLGNPPERGEVALDEFKGAPQTVTTSTPKLNRYFSLLVSDVDTVSSITFSAVMDHLAKQSGDPLFGKEMLFHQWWDSSNKGPGLLSGPHCDDVPPTDKLKDFPYTCPRLEGNQATNPNVFSDEGPDPSHNQDAYSAIAFSNRFDLLSPAQKAGNGLVTYPDCGEYRIIFALNSGKTTPPALAPDHTLHPGNIFNRNLISFEFRVKNPNPTLQRPGVPKGCLPILKFWYTLSDTTSAKKRGELFFDFFMKGKMIAPDGESFGTLPSPIVDIRNLKFDTGQIRTNQFMNTVTNIPAVPPTSYTPGVPAKTKVTPNDWLLREFRVLIDGRKVLIVPDSTKSTPGSFLFRAVAPGPAYDPRLKILLEAIRTQIKDLLGGETNGHFDNLADINSIKFSMLKLEANAYQSDEGSPVPCVGPSTCNPDEGNIESAFNSSSNDNLKTDIQDDVAAAGVLPKPITPIDIVDRLRSQTCAGCHQFSDTKEGPVGFDDPKEGLGGGAHWPTKACGDYGPTCTISTFLITDPKKLHPPMQFTQISEVILTPSVADNGQGWRYAISSTVECMLDYREKFMETALGLPLTEGTNCPH
jgi:hypothetical protein